VCGQVSLLVARSSTTRQLADRLTMLAARQLPQTTVTVRLSRVIVNGLSASPGVSQCSQPRGGSGLASLRAWLRRLLSQLTNVRRLSVCVVRTSGAVRANDTLHTARSRACRAGLR
jgi:hypothetical protein